MTHLTRRYVALVAVFVVAALSAGCLVKETTSTLRLEPDGSVHWAILEHNVHATGDTAADRQRQEREFMALAEAGANPVAEALRTLGGASVSTRVVVASWPFAVLTEADFPDIARLVQECARQMGVRLQSGITRNDRRVRWTIEFDASEQPADRSSSESSPLFDLLPDDRTALFLREGQFVEAVGFTISDDGRVARLDDLSKRDWEKEPRLHLSLVWTTAEGEAMPSLRGSDGV